MQDKKLAELERSENEYQEIARVAKLNWKKKRNKMSHLTPKKKKRK